MNPQLFQSIQLMALPLQELKFRIQEELEKNPALEVMEDNSLLSIEDIPKKQKDDYDFFENTSDPGYSRRLDEEASNAKHKFMEGALSRPESLQEHLIWQLRLQPIPETTFQLGELLIRNLDENGFHHEDPHNLVSEEKWDALDNTMQLIQTFEPVGVCTGDYVESLLVQSRLIPGAPNRTGEVISNYLEFLEKGKYPEIAKKLKIPESQVMEILNYIKTLNPFPGRVYSMEKPKYVIPDLLVKLKDGLFVIVMNDEEIPVLGVNPFFTSIINNQTKKSEKKVKQFAKSSIKDAKWFIHSIHQRNATLKKVSKAIVEFQRDFFLRGKKYLVPLTLKDIAAEVGVHEATISRITNGKYAQTEWGIFELKYFFSNSISGAGSNGSRFSKVGVKEIIREIIEEEEEKEKHLSDQKISDLLAKRGINIARRTVTKYRKELDISSSYKR